MEGRPIAIHEHHGSREVEDAGGEDAEAGPGVEGVAGRETRGVEVVATPGQHQGGEHCERGDQGEAQQRHAALRKAKAF